jgi:hypothetical protein
MIEQQSFDGGLEQVDKVIVTADVRELMGQQCLI